MSEQATPVDMQAATDAVLAGQSLAEHLGFSQDLTRLFYATAVGHYEAGRYPESIQVLMQLTPLEPRNPDAWALLGNCMLREGRFAEALEAWSLSLHLKPSYPTALQVARAAVAQKDRATAAVALMAMHKHGTTPEHQATFIEVGQALMALAD